MSTTNFQKINGDLALNGIRPTSAQQAGARSNVPFGSQYAPPLAVNSSTISGDIEGYVLLVSSFNEKLHDLAGITNNYVTDPYSKTSDKSQVYVISDLKSVDLQQSNVSDVLELDQNNPRFKSIIMNIKNNIGGCVCYVDNSKEQLPLAKGDKVKLKCRTGDAAFHCKISSLGTTTTAINGAGGEASAKEKAGGEKQYGDIDPGGPIEGIAPTGPETEVGSPFVGFSDDQLADRYSWIIDGLIRDLNLKDFQAAALIGNFIAESGKSLNPAIRENTKGKRLTILRVGGYGWAQWTWDSRRVNFIKVTKRKFGGYDITKKPATDDMNYVFVVWEMRNTFKNYTYNPLKSSANITKANEIVSTTYEAPFNICCTKDPALRERTIKSREGNAKEVLRIYRDFKKKNLQTSKVAPTS